MSISGKSDSLSDVFYIDEGVLLVDAVHSGRSNFIVRIFPESGDFRTLSISHIGSYSGRRIHAVSEGPFTINPGAHRVEVMADGEWRLDLLQAPTTGRGIPLPVSEAGKGDAVVGPVEISAGTTPVHLTHTGSSNFLFEAINVNGIQTEHLVNEIGVYDGSVALSASESNNPFILKPSAYFIPIQADGEWSIRLQR